jgi:hypothetical protein
VPATCTPPEQLGRHHARRFCLAPYGWGWGIRLTQTLLLGCVPVIIQPHVFQPFEDVLDYDAFSVRLPRCGVAKAAARPCAALWSSSSTGWSKVQLAAKPRPARLFCAAGAGRPSVASPTCSTPSRTSAGWRCTARWSSSTGAIPSLLAERATSSPS